MAGRKQFPLSICPSARIAASSCFFLPSHFPLSVDGKRPLAAVDEAWGANMQQMENLAGKLML